LKACETKEAHDALMTLIPYGGIGEPEDIARVERAALGAVDRIHDGLS